MKKLGTKLKKAFALPILGIICAASIFGGLVSLNALPTAAAEGTTAEGSATNDQATTYKNLALSKTYTAPTAWSSFTASLTDGVADDTFNYGNDWYGVNDGGGSGYANLVENGWIESDTAVYGYQSDIVIDLSSVQLFSKVRMHVCNQADNAYLSGASLSTSLDGVTYTLLDKFEVKAWSGSMEKYWTEIALSEAAPARYVKITVATVKRFFLNEIEVLQKAEAVAENLALGKTITGDANADGWSASVDTLVDGQTYTGWSSSYSYGHINVSNDFVIDLGEVTSWNSVRVHGNLSSGSGIKAPTDKKVFVSDDNETWTELGTLAVNEKNTSEYWAEGTFSATSRYVKITLGRSGAGGWYAIDEIEVNRITYGDSLEACDAVVIGEKEYVSDNNIALGKKVSGEDGQWSATRESLTDGKTPGGWQYGFNHPDAEKYNHYLIVDLGEKLSWNSVKLHGNIDSGSGILTPNSVSVYASNDAISWTSVGSLTIGETVDNGYWVGDGDVFNTVTSRYVRIVITRYGAFTSFDEIEVYEPTDVVTYTPYENNVAGYATISADSSLDDTKYSALTLNDGNIRTGVATNKTIYVVNGSSATKYVTFAFGKDVKWNSVRVHCVEESSWGIKVPTGIVVAYSADGNNFTDWTSIDMSAIENNWVAAVGEEVTSKYVRVGLIGGIIAIDEVEILADNAYGTDETAECFLSRGATVSGEANSLGDKKDISSLVDGDKPTGYSTSYGKTGAFVDITLDLGAVKNWKSISVHGVVSTSAGVNAVQRILVYSSIDGETWTDLGGLTIPTELDEYSCYEAKRDFNSGNISARYIKLNVGRDSGWWAINEIEIGGKHSIKSVAEVPATTENAGMKAHYECENCKTKYTLGDNNEYVAVSESDLIIEKIVITVPDGCANFAVGKTVTGPDSTWGEVELSTLTDGLTPGGKQYGRYGAGKAEYLIVDLGEVKDWSFVKFHGIINSSIGIYESEWSAISVSDDNATWTDVGQYTIVNKTSTDYWGVLNYDGHSRYVRIAFGRWGSGTVWCLDEIQVGGTHSLEEVAEKPATKLTTGTKAHYKCSACGAKYLLNNNTYVYEEVSDADLVISRLTGFYAVSMTINNNFDVNFQAYVAGNPQSVQVKCILNGNETIVDGVAVGNDYNFVFKKLGPQNLGKTVTVCLIVDGVEKESKEFVATDYLKQVFDQGDSEQQQLIADIFEYGAAAQDYVGDSGTRINTLYSAVAAKKSSFTAPSSTKKSIVENNAVDGFEFVGAKLRLSSEMKVVFQFNAGAGFRLTVNDVDVTSDVISVGGVYEYCTNGISVVSFDDEVVARLYSGSTLVQTVTYSVNSYVYSKYSSSNATLAALVKSIHNYGLSAVGAKPIDRTLDRVNVAKNESYTSSLTSATDADLTDGVTYLDSSRVTTVNEYAAYTAGQELSIVLNLGKQVSNLGAFELYAYKGELTQKSVTYNGVLPSCVTVYISSDNSAWQKVGESYATTKNQSEFCYMVELPYALGGSYVKFVATATGSSSDYYLISEARALVYSNDVEENDVYSGGAQFSAVTEDVYYGSKETLNTNLIEGKLAKIEASGKVEKNYQVLTGYMYNTPASESGIMTDGTEVTGSGTLGTWTDADRLFNTNDKYFKFYAQDYRRISYDLGSICDIKSVTFRAFRHDSSYCKVPDQVFVCLSMDGVTWYNFGTIEYTSTNDKKLNEKTLTVERTARFVAFEFEVDKWAAIDELEVKGKHLKNASNASYTRIDESSSSVVANVEPIGYPSSEGYASNVYLAYHCPSGSGWGNVTQSEIEKVVAYHDVNGNMTAPMFDGVMFLLNGALTEATYSPGAAMKMTANSLVQLKDSLYATGDFSDTSINVSALNSAVQKMKDQNVVGSDYKVKVYFTLYYPEGVTDDYSFGSYSYGDESVSDISSTANKLQLLKLFIKNMEADFSFDNLEIGGYYWYTESVGSTDQATVIQGVSEYLDSINRKFLWIPYYDASGLGDWQTNGFDIAIYQPNYAFDLNIQSSRIDIAATIAKKYGMAIEFEMDTLALTDARYRARYFEYLSRAKELGYADTVHFYYFGTKLSTCLADNSGAGREIYDATYDFIQDGVISKPQTKPMISVTAQKGDSTDIAVLSGIGDSASILLREPPKHGSVTVNADGSLTYHAEADYSGVVTFTYSYAYGGVYSDPCAVTINVL